MFKAQLLRGPGSQGLWFNPHPPHVVASLDKDIYDAYLCLEEFTTGSKLTEQDFKQIGNLGTVKLQAGEDSFSNIYCKYP